MAGPVVQSDAGAAQAEESSEADIVPRYVLAELQRLPAARPFPPAFRHRATCGDRRKDALLALQPRGKPAAAAQDPTARLLQDAADQLSKLVKEQLQRRVLRRTARVRLPIRDLSLLEAWGRGHGSSRICCFDDIITDSEAGSDGEQHDEEAQHPQPAAQQLQQGQELPGGAFAARSRGFPPDTSTEASVSAASASVGASASLPDSGNTTWSVKRARMQRQYAIDLQGHCLLDGELLPLPQPQELAG